MRIEDWESLLNGYIAEAYRDPFAWGSRDCALWATDWVLLCTGVDHGGPWRGKYKTEAGAAKRMKKLGFANVEAIADAHPLWWAPLSRPRAGDS